MIARAELQKRLLAALSARPEIHAIYAFGRQVMGPLDEYSDLDLVICSRDLEKTRSEYPSIFSTISPIRAQLILLNQSDVYAAMSLLRDVAPYQKIDFSIVSDIEMQAGFGPFQTLYQDDKKEGAGAALKILTFTDDLQNQLNDVLFSIPRFTKCLFRRDFYQYQRWQGVLNRALGLLYEKHFEPATSKLNSRQYQEMYAVLSETEIKNARYPYASRRTARYHHLFSGWRGPRHRSIPRESSKAQCAFRRGLHPLHAHLPRQRNTVFSPKLIKRRPLHCIAQFITIKIRARLHRMDLFPFYPKAQDHAQNPRSRM